MDIQKPKPWRGVREFLKEYLIIVVGVLTALGAEQAAVALRDRTAAAEAREAIGAEVVIDLTRIQQRDFAHECVEARLDDIERIVDGAAADGRIRAPTWIGRPPRYAVESVRWEAASQSGRVSLLPSKWQSRLGFVYTTLRYYYDLNNAEEQTWSRLDGLTGLDRLSPDGKLTIKGEIEQARFYNGSLHQIAGLVLRRAAEEGLRPTVRHDAAFTACWPTTLPTAEGRARLAAKEAEAFTAPTSVAPRP